MAEAEISFQIRVMRPPQPASSLEDPTVKNEPRTFRLSLLPNDTFREAWKKIQEQYDESYPEHERELACFTRIQDHLGCDFAMSQRVGAHFNESKTIEQCVLVVQQTAIDKECSLAPGTLLQPKDYKRKRLADLTPDRQDAFKRRRVQEGRYGSSVNDLDADTPVRSREKAQESVQDAEQEDEQVLQLDNEGFKVPPKPKTIKKPGRQQNSQTLQSSQATVLVQDSQPQQALERPQSSASALQLRTASREQQSRSAPSVDSSPAEAPAARATTVTAHRSPASLNSRQRTIPTPDSHANFLSSDDAPTSARRPRDSNSSLHDRSRQFVRRRSDSARDSEQDIAVEDPIEDDENDVIADFNDDDDVLVEPRGRTRSRSLESNPQLELSSDNVDRESSTPLPNGVNENAPTDNTEVDMPSSNNAYDKMQSSSQVARKSSERAASAGTRWSAEEDRALIEGHRRGWNVSLIRKKFNLDRSDSSLRNRSKSLKAMGLLPGNTGRSKRSAIVLDDGENDDGENDLRADVPRSSQRQEWTDQEVERLRKAMRGGYDAGETAASFPSRSLESIGKKMKDQMPAVVRFEMAKESFPRTEVEVEGWKDVHNFRLRRVFVQKVNEDDAHKQWFSGVNKDGFKRKLADYKIQMEALGSTANDRTREGSVNRQAREVNSAAGGELRGRASTNPNSQPAMNSSPPETSNTRNGNSPAVIVLTQEQREANQGQDKAPAVENEQRTRTSGQQRRGHGNLVQANLGQFLRRDKRKRADRPARPSTSDLDAQFRRVSTRATANPQQQAESQAQSSVRLGSGSNGVDVKSDEDGETAFQMLEREYDPQEQLDSQLQPHVWPGSDSQLQRELESQPDPASALVDDCQLVPDAQSESDIPVELSTQPASNSQHDLDSQLLRTIGTQANVKPDDESHLQSSVEITSVRPVEPATQQTRQPVRRGQPGRLPSRTGSVSRFQQRVARNLEEMRARSNDETPAH